MEASLILLKYRLMVIVLLLQMLLQHSFKGCLPYTMHHLWLENDITLQQICCL